MKLKFKGAAQISNTEMIALAIILTVIMLLLTGHYQMAVDFLKATVAMPGNSEVSN